MCTSVLVKQEKRVPEAKEDLGIALEPVGGAQVSVRHVHAFVCVDISDVFVYGEARVGREPRASCDDDIVGAHEQFRRTQKLVFNAL